MSGVGRAGLALLGAALVLGGCATRGPPRADADRAALPESVSARALALSSLETWSFRGRVAVSDGQDGGSGRIEWTQAGPNYVIVVRTPVSNQTWRLSGDATQCLLEGAKRGPIRGRDPGELLQRETGWRLPLAAIRSWVRGVPGDPARARVRVDADGLPDELIEDGWVVRYGDFAVATEGAPPLPKRIRATRGDHEVRLAIADWTLRGE